MQLNIDRVILDFYFIEEQTFTGVEDVKVISTGCIVRQVKIERKRLALNFDSGSPNPGLQSFVTGLLLTRNQHSEKQNNAQKSFHDLNYTDTEHKNARNDLQIG